MNLNTKLENLISKLQDKAFLDALAENLEEAINKSNNYNISFADLLKNNGAFEGLELEFRISLSDEQPLESIEQSLENGLSIALGLCYKDGHLVVS